MDGETSSETGGEILRERNAELIMDNPLALDYRKRVPGKLLLMSRQSNALAVLGKRQVYLFQ